MKKVLVAILSLFVVALTLPLQAAEKTEKSLYERLGGVFAIAMVVDHFSDAVVQNPIGLGLGLSICRRNVEANSGVLSVRDVPGSGCIFTIDLPRH